MEETEMQEYINKLKSDENIIKDIPQETILELLKNRDKLKIGWIQNSALEKALDNASIRKIINENDVYKYKKSELLRFVVTKKDFDFVNEVLPDINDDDEARGTSLAKALTWNLHYEKDKSQFLKLFIEEREKYGFSSEDMMRIISETEDEDYIIRCLEEAKKYGLNSKDARLLIGYVDYPQYVKEKYGEDLLTSFDESIKIKLPKQMTAGIEIESEGPASLKLLDYYVEDLIEDLDEWEIDEDGSLNDAIDDYTREVKGVEFISPVLRSGEDAEKQIHQVCTFLNYCQQEGNEDTGAHVHIGADYLTNINAYENLIEMWANTEKILYIIANKEGEAPRDVTEYAAPFSKKMKEAIENGFEAENLEDFISKIKEIQGDKYSSINFLNVGNSTKNTIEFRLANGTIDPKTWVENINLFGGIVAAAQELSIIQEKEENGETLADEERQKLSTFEKITTSQNEDEKLKALLDLSISKEDQDIYFRRYEVNKELVKDRAIVEDVGSVKITRKKVGKLAFVGKNAIDGVEYMQGTRILESDLARETIGNTTPTISE